MKAKNIKETERQSQRTVVEYVRRKYPDVIIFAIPNGGSRNKIEAANLKKDGVLAGVPDLFIAKSRLSLKQSDIIHGLFIEMKSRKGTLSNNQKSIMWALDGSGYACKVCRSADEAIKIIDEYLK